MKFILKTSIILLYCALSVLAKGGGGGRGGGGGSSGGGGRGGGGGSSGGGGKGGGGSSSGGGRGSSGSGSSGGGTALKTPKGATGTFRNGAPPAYSNTRSNYKNYPPAYSGGYTAASRSGYRGSYMPGMMYFAIMPPFLFLGYHSAYHRYNQNDGYYYAPAITEQGSNTQHVMINGTTNSGKDENYRYTFDISTDNQFPISDHSFYSSSDPNAHPADFAYRVQTTQIIEFDDANQNGFHDFNERILSVTTLQNLKWQNFLVSNITVPNNPDQNYLQTSTFANVTYNNTSPAGSTGNPSFRVLLTYRASNLQLNNTAPIVMQPNSLQYDFAVEGFPNTIAKSHPNAKLAFVQVLSYPSKTPVVFDVNTTTPVDVANQIKTNLTYGISIGEYTQGRLEFQNTVNITKVPPYTTNAWTLMKPADLAAISTFNPWTWGNPDASNTRDQELIFVTVPGYSNFNGTGLINASYSGFGFLDTDVMNAMAGGEAPNSGAATVQHGKLTSLLLVSLASLYFII
ncbi:hypothetical protein EDC94DRAFT_606904 [Helicostylum pulchrum]|nr:hypothetical protein EDC94DRAFT_606904 [Helicostylum pulchrum]